jgi:phospholipid/cholesterol/gamma-HCH transport system substrate-binding protein
VIKQAPSLGRIVAMIVFALSCFGILMFLWLAFGGSLPLRPESYRFTVPFKEATTLAVEADVREAGVNVGRVKAKKLDKRGARTLVTIEMKPQYAPIAKDTRAILRQKTLLGETYVELAPGHRSEGLLQDGGELAATRVQPTVELDEIFSAFTPGTRQAFRDWVRELRRASQGRASESLNDALGNLAGFSADGARLFRTLDEQRLAVRRLIRNTGQVFGAINERQGALRQLIVNANEVFEATAARDRALADTFRVFPTFLDESKATMARLERFSRNTHPLVSSLKGPADDLAPTLRDLGRLSPDLEGLFRDLRPVIRSSRTTVPKLRRLVAGAEPVLESFGPFLDQLNPILSYFNFHQATIAGFLSNAAANIGPDFQGQAKQVNIGMIEPRSFEPPLSEIPEWARGQAYLAPNALTRAQGLGTFESFLCPGGKERPNPVDNPPPGGDKQPPCFNSPPSLFNGKKFVLLEKGKVPRVDAPGPFDGTKDANPGTP